MRKTIVLLSMMTIIISAGICRAQGNKPPATTQQPVVNQQPLEPTQTLQEGATVPANQEYQPEVIIEGKWGTGPGEFGQQADVDESYFPKSVAVDSKGNIYVLDLTNNRIQKFSSQGIYQNSIEVDSFKGEIYSWMEKRFDGDWGGAWAERMKKPENAKPENVRPNINPTETLGINIVIDSKDDLYYYLIHPKANTGEVWKLVKDKVKDKWGVPYKGYLSEGIELGHYDDSVWIRGIIDKNNKLEIKKSYSVTEKKEYDKESLKNRDDKLMGRGKGRIKRRGGLNIEVNENGIKVVKYTKK